MARDDRFEEAEALIVANMRRFRQARGLSQGELAKRVGISRSNVTALEAGTRRPPAGLLPTIANELGITVGELFGEAPSSSLDVIDRAVERRLAALLDAARRSLPRE